MDTHAFRQRLLAKAALRVGGAAMLAVYLKVPEDRLEAWLAGTAAPPVEVVLRAIDLVMDEAPSR